MACDLQSDADDAIGSKRVGLLFHACHGQFACVIHGLAEDIYFLVLSPANKLKADVVNGTSYDESDGIKTSFAYEQELVDAEVAGEKAVMFSIAPHGAESLTSVNR